MWTISKKELIYNSWVKLFWKYWVKRVSIDMLVNDAQVAKWTFYIYYKNKQELYEEIVDDILNNWKKIITKLHDIFPDVKERFFTHIIWALRFFEENMIIKNIVIWNTNYFIWKINVDYLFEKHLEILKILFWKEFNNEKKILNIAKVKWFFIETLNNKKSFIDINEYEKFVLNLAAILTNWLFSDYVWLVNWRGFSDFQINK